MHSYRDSDFSSGEEEEDWEDEDTAAQVIQGFHQIHLSKRHF